MLEDKSLEELDGICHKIRSQILDTVSKNGGHLSSTLGAVELIVAMHYVFDVEKDPFIFDVSHQAYAHKLLTGREKEFKTLRQFGGLSGFTKPKESQYDYFISGHSSTSISLAVGAAKAIGLNGEEDRIPVALIGDGSMTSGMVYEALNELGDRKYPVIIVLNDNDMSIAKPIGAISNYLSQVVAGKFYQKIKRHTKSILEHFPDGTLYLAKKFEESIKLITPGILFEELGIEYIGPVDGHSLKELIDTFNTAKRLKKPVIVHAQTIKGKGYKKAEGQHESWHGVGKFDIDSGESLKQGGDSSATSIFSNKLFDLASKDKKIVGLTAAMPSGTGMNRLIDNFPDRFWDVAIAEQHAVTSMSAMAKEGFKPFIAIYSTFLQRAYDQIIHDSAISNLPVKFAIDRAGIVGEDGETHQGVFDISYLRVIPNMTLFAPRDAQMLERCMEFSLEFQTPIAFRYPRGSFQKLPFKSSIIEYQKAEILRKGSSEIAFIGYGSGVARAYSTMKELDKDITLVDLIFVKPLDKSLLIELSKSCKRWFVFSDSVKAGGVGSALLEFTQEHRLNSVEIESFEYEDSFIEHGATKLVEESLGLLPKQLANKVQDYIDS
jgi:1-deoxy-D-xylulose-5-phosphate synthase